MALAPIGQIQVVDPSTVRLSGYATITGVPFSYVDPYQGRRRTLQFDRGAFDAWLSDNGGDVLPIYWSHRSDRYQIGETTHVSEDAQGLRFEGDAIATSDAIDALTTMARRRHTGASLHLDFEPPKKDRYGVEHIAHVTDVYELGPTPVGANPAAYAVMIERDAETNSNPEPAAVSVATDAAIAATIYRAAARLRRF